MRLHSLALLTATALFLAGCAKEPAKPAEAPRLQAERLPEKAGWIQVRLVGSPKEIGFQHGSLLAPEILDAKKAIEHLVVHDTKKDWAWFRKAAQDVLWPKTDPEYQQEMQAIADGLKSKGVDLDVWDVTAMNGWMELAWYYVPVFDKQNKVKTPKTVRTPEHCSAFVATGSYTRDGKVVMAHNSWVDYIIGERWRILFDIRPEKGNRIFMDGFPGLIHSADDFGVNSAGLIITETTLPAFNGFDVNGVPEYSRARKAMQYASTIDEFVRIMKEGNNGGYANTWLVADRNTGEIASLELGLKNVTLDRKKDGYFVGSNYAANANLIKEETSWDPNDKANSGCARRTRWIELMEQNKGQIDVGKAQAFLGDTYDVILKKDGPDERTLCGRIDLSPRGLAPWQPPYGPAGAVQNKAIDAALAGEMKFHAAYGPQCGPEFQAAPFTAKHKGFAWQLPLLRDMPSGAWTLFETAR